MGSAAGNGFWTRAAALLLASAIIVESPARAAGTIPDEDTAARADPTTLFSGQALQPSLDFVKGFSWRGRLFTSTLELYRGLTVKQRLSGRGVAASVDHEANRSRLENVYARLAAHSENMRASQMFISDISRLAAIQEMFVQGRPIETDIWGIALQDFPAEFVSFLQKLSEEWLSLWPSEVPHHLADPSRYHINLTVPQALPKLLSQSGGVLRRADGLSRKDLHMLFGELWNIVRRQPDALHLIPEGLFLGEDGALIMAFRYAPALTVLKQQLTDAIRRIRPDLSGRPKPMTHITLFRPLANFEMSAVTVERIHAFMRKYRAISAPLQNYGLARAIVIPAIHLYHETRWMHDQKDLDIGLFWGRTNVWSTIRWAWEMTRRNDPQIDRPGDTRREFFPIQLGLMWTGRSRPYLANKEAGYAEPTDEEIEDYLEYAFADMGNRQGVVMLDTAAAYGPSEERLGRILQHHKDWFERASLWTKGGEEWDPATGQSRLAQTKDELLHSFHRSLGRLRKLNGFYVHQASLMVLNDPEAMGALRELKERHIGGLQYLGLSISRPDILEEIVRAATANAPLLEGLDYFQIPTKVFLERPDLVKLLHEQGIRFVLNRPNLAIKEGEDPVKFYRDLAARPERPVILGGGRTHLQETVDYLKGRGVWLTEEIRRADPQAVRVKAEVIKGPGRQVARSLANRGEIGRGLATAIEAAVRISIGLHEKGLIGSGDKAAIDNEGDRLMRDALRRSPEAWSVAGAEGAGDGMETAASGQTFGRSIEKRMPIDIAYDPVDGTSSAASNAAGSVVLIGIGPHLQQTADVRHDQSVGLLVPKLLTELPIELEGPPEAAVPQAIRLVAEALHKPLAQMRVALWPDPLKAAMMQGLASMGVEIIFLNAAAETIPLLGNDVRGQDCPFDAVVTGEGLIEAEIGAMLTEQRGGHGWVRVGPGPVSRIRDWVGQGLENYVVLGAITANPWLKLDAPVIDRESGAATVQMLVSDPSGVVVKLTIQRNISLPPEVGRPEQSDRRMKRAG